MACLISLFTTFVLLLFHLGCFHIFPSADHRSPTRKRKASPNSGGSSPSRLKKAISSSWSSLRCIFSSKFAAAGAAQTSTSSQVPPETHLSDGPIIDTKPYGVSANPFLPLRNHIFPCTICGEIFPNSQLLEQHESTKHAVSEMRESDAGKNIVRMIFEAGWTETRRVPEIHRILKIHHSQKMLTRFEEYREAVKARASRNGAVERCAADGNEVLRFHCATFTCGLGQNGNSSVCGQRYCGVCGIIRSGFSPKMDGIATLAGSWRAHVSLPEEVEDDFSFMNVKRAVLVCRVVAGRVGCETDHVDKGDAGFDSRVDGEELLVFNPKAVLPCFVIVYSTVCAAS